MKNLKHKKLFLSISLFLVMYSAFCYTYNLPTYPGEYTEDIINQIQNLPVLAKLKPFSTTCQHNDVNVDKVNTVYECKHNYNHDNHVGDYIVGYWFRYHDETYYYDYYYAKPDKHRFSVKLNTKKIVYFEPNEHTCYICVNNELQISHFDEDSVYIDFYVKSSEITDTNLNFDGNTYELCSSVEKTLENTCIITEYVNGVSVRTTWYNDNGEPIKIKFKNGDEIFYKDSKCFYYKKNNGDIGYLDYDDIGHCIEMSEFIDGKHYITKMDYDDKGREIHSIRTLLDNNELIISSITETLSYDDPSNEDFITSVKWQINNIQDTEHKWDSNINGFVFSNIEDGLEYQLEYINDKMMKVIPKYKHWFIVEIE